jgi:predicted metal-binding protein
MKKFDPKFTIGSLFICSKCGQGFNSTDQAEKLKTELRADLKKNEAHTKVRVMVSGCLGICENDQQTFAYYPNSGPAEIYTTGSDFSDAKTEIFALIQTKV